MDEFEIDANTVMIHEQTEAMDRMSTNVLRASRLTAVAMILTALIIRSGMNRK